MRVLLVGGGKVGSYLARELIEAGHVVTVVERNETLAQNLTDALPVLVLSGDGTEVGLLERAEVGRMDWVLGVTGSDEANLVTCQLASTLGAGQVLARLNDPKNRATFEALDVPVVAVTDLMASVISQEIKVTDLNRIAVIGHGRISVLERTVGEGFPPLPLRDLALPKPTVLAAMIRGDEVLVPGATTVLEPGDRVVAITTLDHEAALCALLDGEIRAEES